MAVLSRPLPCCAIPDARGTTAARETSRAEESDESFRGGTKHRGYRLVKSRRRKPGGDFGRYGLKTADGAEAFGFANGALSASADDIAAFLRDAARSTWDVSAGGVRTKAPPPRRAPKPAPRPRFKVELANLFAPLPPATRAEAFTELASHGTARVERIVSQGQVTPPDAPMIQQADEWVAVLAGEAALRIEDSDEVVLRPGDHVLIRAGQRHWVTRTLSDPPTVWLAVHLSAP